MSEAQTAPEAPQNEGSSQAPLSHLDKPGYAVPREGQEEAGQEQKDTSGKGEHDRQAALLDGKSPEELREHALRASQAATRYRQQAKSEVSELQQQIAKLSEKFEERFGVTPEEADEGDEIPDKVTDPVGHLEYLIKTATAPLADLQKRAEESKNQEDQAKEQQRRIQEFAQRSAQDRQSYVAGTLAPEVFNGDADRAQADYDAAAQWVVEQRYNEIAGAFPHLQHDNIMNAIVEEALGPNGILSDPEANRAAAIYSAALQRGWTPGSGAGKPTGSSVTPPQTPARNQVANARRAQQESGAPPSASRAPGAGKSGIPTDPAEFKKALEEAGSMGALMAKHGKVVRG